MKDLDPVGCYVREKYSSPLKTSFTLPLILLDCFLHWVLMSHISLQKTKQTKENSQDNFKTNLRNNL